MTLPLVSKDVVDSINAQLRRANDGDCNDYAEELLDTFAEEQPELYGALVGSVNQLMNRMTEVSDENQALMASNLMWYAACVYQSLRNQKEANDLAEQWA